MNKYALPDPNEALRSESPIFPLVLRDRDLVTGLTFEQIERNRVEYMAERQSNYERYGSYYGPCEYQRPY